MGAELPPSKQIAQPEEKLRPWVGLFGKVSDSVKKVLSVILCLMLMCGAVLLPSCTARRDDPYHYYDLPPNWAPAAQLPNDAVIYNDETGIPDRALYIAVLHALGRSSRGTFTAGEAASLTSITIVPVAVHVRELENDEDTDWFANLVPSSQNLIGIEHLRTLEELHMEEVCSVNWISLSEGLACFSELRRLEHLPHLRRLFLFHMHIHDLRPLRNLTGLTTLNIRGLTSFDGIQHLTNLESFRLNGQPQDLQELRQRYR